MTKRARAFMATGPGGEESLEAAHNGRKATNDQEAHVVCWSGRPTGTEIRKVALNLVRGAPALRRIG